MHRALCMDLKKGDISVLYECTPKVISAEEDINNQVDRITHSMDTSRSLFPVTHVTVQWVHKQSVHGSRDEVMHGLSKMDFSLRLIWQWPPLTEQSASSRDLN